MGLPRINEVARLWRDPELRFTPAGKAVCELPLVFNKRVQGQDGQWQDAGSMFVRGTVWEQAAENCANALVKGDDVLVSGELSVREFERKDGSKGQSVELRVFEVGPSMKRNPVRVDRPGQASSGSPSSSQSGGGDPWSTAPTPTGPAGPDDEPPF